MERRRGEAVASLFWDLLQPASATPQPVSWLQREASGRAWVTSGPGLSHRQRPGCPATRKGTKGSFDVQRPSSRDTRLDEQQARAFLPPPHPRLPSFFRDRPGQIQPGLLRGHRPLAWQRQGRSPPKKKKGRGFLWGFLTAPFGIPRLPASLWCHRTQGIAEVRKECGKGGRCLPPSLGRTLLCLCALTLRLCTPTSGCQREFVLPDSRGLL